MSTVCITGHSGPALEYAASLLHHAGMALARPTEEGRAITVQQWHEQMLARTGDDAAALLSPGRMWEKLAADLLIANLDSACWGWASPQSVPLLGFWSSFDPQMRFVLVCEPLDRMVAKHIRDSHSCKDLPSLLAQWHQTHEGMLRFHLRHPQSSVLVWGHTLASHGQEHLANWVTAWHLPLTPTKEPSSPAAHVADSEPSNALLAYLAQQVIVQFPAAVALNDELAASVWASELAEFQNHSSPADIDSLISGLQLIQADVIAYAEQAEQAQEKLSRAAQSLLALSAERDALALAKTKQDHELETACEVNDKLFIKVQTLQDELNDELLKKEERKAALEAEINTAAALKGERDQLSQDKVALTKARDTELKAKQALQAERDQLAKEKAQSDSSLKDAQEESELLLAQLHQVQEELERQFLSCQDLKEKLEAQTKTTAALTAERDGLSQDKVTLTKARDTELKAKQALQAERDQLAKDVATAAAARDTELKAKQALQAERDALAKDKAKSDSSLKDANEKSELLLAQLHKVREELERQFLDNQANKLHLHQSKASNARVMASFPGAFDCESLQLISGGDTSTPWRWRAQNLGVAGHHVEQLEFETVIEQGLTGIALQRNQDKPEPMLRWPLSAKSTTTTMLIPLHKEQGGVNHMAVLAQLSASDWDMTQALHRLLVRQLAQGRPSVPAAEQTLLLQATLKTREMMRQLQDLMRFDAVTLLGHQAIDTREVLSLQFTHLSHRSERLADFKFQLQAQPISTGAGSQLGGTVHLIVGRDTAAAPFEPWISNANDGSGLAVMAIPLTERGPMAAVWERLSTADRAFVAALVDALPLAMALLSAQGKKLPRPWKDWSELIKQVRQWVRLPPAQEPAKPTPPASEPVSPVPAKRQRQRQSSLSVAPVIAPLAPQAPAAQKAPATKKAPAAKKQTKLAPLAQPAAKKAPATQKAPAAKKQTKLVPLTQPAAKKAAVPQTRAHAKKPAAQRSARPRVSAKAGK